MNAILQPRLNIYALPGNSIASKRSFGQTVGLIGPAIVASIAYLDPGNFAVNIQAGAQFGYGLLAVVIIANVLAMVFQSLSSKLGVATNLSLPKACSLYFPKWVVSGMWIFSEIGIMATDLAEFMGASLGFTILFHIPLFYSMLLTLILTTLILWIGKNDFRRIEYILAIFISVIAVCFLCELWFAPVNWHGVIQGLSIPHIPNGGAWVLCAGIIGATVMPHALYLHSGLTKRKTATLMTHDKLGLIRFFNKEMIITLTIVGLINLAMVVFFSAAFHAHFATIVDMQTAFNVLTPLLGSTVAGLFLLALIVSGVSSSAVSVLAGDMIMQEFVSFKIPLLLRRIITILPAFIIVAWGINAMQALIFSQVILSIILPIPMLALVFLMSKEKVMGPFVNGKWMQRTAVCGAALVIMINLILVLRCMA